jgi:serine/threonine-protein kinase
MEGGQGAVPTKPARLDGPPTSDEPGDKAKGNTNIDTIIGRIVVDQGLCTPEEVQECFEAHRSAVDDPSGASLAQLLVHRRFLTERQLRRVREAAEAEKSGQQIPGYKILGKLGAGAMATVYKAKQLSLDRLVAIKVLPKKYTSSAQFIERFYAEGRAAAQLNHPNIVAAFDVGKAGEYHYFVMEYVDGRTVYDDIVKHKRYPEKDAIDVVIQIAEALQHAHDRGLIHRDVKPKNIMIAKEGVAKLADMGLARAISDKEAAEAEQGKAFGTPYYISPEQIRGELKVGPPADIYSLGATLYHMVVGAVPFDGKNPSAVMHQHLKGELRSPDHVNPKLTAGISEVIEMMMAKDPRNRYQSCSDVLIDLRAVRAGKTPPLAHRDLGGSDLSTLSKAEAAAPVEIVEDTSASSSRRGISVGLFVTMCVLLVASVVVNMVLLGMRAGSN